jgi:hypothetical protein
MTKMKEIRSATFEESDRTDAIQDDYKESSVTQMNFVDDDFVSWFERKDGKELINIKILAQPFDKTNKDCIQILTKNVELFIRDHFDFIGITPQKSEIALNQKRERRRVPKEIAKNNNLRKNSFHSKRKRAW